MLGSVVLAVAGGCSSDTQAPSTPPITNSGAAGQGGGGTSNAGGATTAGSAGQVAAGSGGAAGGAGSGGTGGGAAGSGTGGSGGAAGAAGAAGSAGNGGASAGPCGGAIYCDDFDSYSAPGNPGGNWQTSIEYSGNQNGMVSVDTAHAFSGSNSVHFKTPGNTSFEHAFITLKGAPYFPVADNSFYGRMMIYVSQLPGNTVHWTMIQGLGTMVPGQPNLNEAEYRYGGQINGDELMANYDTKPTHSDCAQRSKTKMPRNKWTCIEWHFNGKDKTLELWMDGMQNDALTVKQMSNNTGVCQNQAWSGIWEPPTFSEIGIGFQHYQQGPGELWIDDFGIDTKQLGCPTAPPTAK